MLTYEQPRLKDPNPPTFKRIIPLNEVKEHYPDEAKLAKIFNHEVIEDENGVWRWKTNRFIDLLMNHAPVYAPSDRQARAAGKHDAYWSKLGAGRASIDLNILVVDAYNGEFSIEEYMKFQMSHGYSLGGFREVFGQREASEYKLPGARTEHRRGQDKDDYVETVIEYMLRIHKGKVLKI